MGKCNYCKLKDIKRRKKKDEKVTTLYDSSWGMGGVNVYVHPKEIDIREFPGGEDGERAKYRVAWFMEVGPFCEC